MLTLYPIYFNLTAQEATKLKALIQRIKKQQSEGEEVEDSDFIIKIDTDLIVYYRKNNTAKLCEAIRLKTYSETRLYRLVCELDNLLTHLKG